MPNRNSSAPSAFFSAVFFTLVMGVPAMGESPATAQAQTQPQETLEIYLIDVEGGGATLFVSPTGESLLIDTGNGGPNAARDAGRIMDAMEDAGVAEIDYLITTHWHGDHYGAMEEPASQLPVRRFIDHGPSVESNARVAEFLSTTYRALYQRAEHTVVTPGDRIALAGIDMTGNTEFQLMCPDNPIGTVDLFVVSHHGQPVSNAEVLVHAIEPRVAVMNNGTRKGGQSEAMRVLYSAPGL